MQVSSSIRSTLAAGVALALLLTGCAGTHAPPSARPSPSPRDSDVVTFAAYGAKPVIAAYQKLAEQYMLDHPDTKVRVLPYATHAEATAAFRKASAAGRRPDLFLMDRADLPALSADHAVRRVDDLLAQREVDFGDGYARNGLEAFSADAALQCMPADVSPLVVYYNPRLIDLASIAEPGRRPVTAQDGWSLEQFGQAARQPRSPGVRGLYVAPDLEQVAPFVWSGGGEVTDDLEKPTTLTLSDSASSAALAKLLELVRNPTLTFSQGATRRRSALERFEAGKLGMFLGYRDLTPILRAQRGLMFDVMPMPRLSSGATVARMSGLCISSTSKVTAKAADFLASLISDKGVAALAATGYVVPANLDVLNGADFLQPGQTPYHAVAFTRAVRDAKLLPDTPAWAAVRTAAARELTQLFYAPVILSVDDRLAALDASSALLLERRPSASPTAAPSDAPGPGPTSSP